jgi:predicted GIY-YIG superfamily endonuclease
MKILRSKFYQLLFLFLTKIVLIFNDKNIFNIIANRKINEIINNRTINIDTGLEIIETIVEKDGKCFEKSELNQKYFEIKIKNDNKIVNYVNRYSPLLLPILKIEDKLLCPIVYTEDILNNIKNIIYIFAKFPNYNIIKLFLNIELEKPVTNNAMIDDNSINILKSLKQIKIKNIIETAQTITREFNPIKRDENSYNGNSIFKFNNNIVFVNSKLTLNHYYYDNNFLNDIDIDIDIDNNNIFIKKNTKNRVNTELTKQKGDDCVSYFEDKTCCYIITFNNNLYFYIGSTTNIKNRIKSHNNKINSFDKDLSELFKYFLNSEIHENKKIEYKIRPIYLGINYFTKFKNLFPDYKLSKGEWLLLKKITELIIKILEQSLILNYKPKLNSAEKIAIGQIDWRDEWLHYYGPEKDYKKIPKYSLYYISKIKNDKYCGEIVSFDEIVRYFGTFTLHDLFKRYNFNKDEVLNNLNIYHIYKDITILKNTKIKIVEETELKTEKEIRDKKFQEDIKILDIYSSL